MKGEKKRENVTVKREKSSTAAGIYTLALAQFARAIMLGRGRGSGITFSPSARENILTLLGNFGINLARLSLCEREFHSLYCGAIAGCSEKKEREEEKNGQTMRNALEVYK